jgi:hypothetical protein
MARYTGSATQAGTKTAARGPNVVVGARDLMLREVGVESTTAVSSQVALVRITARVSTGATALTEVDWANDAQAPTASVEHGQTADNTVATGNIRTTHLPAAIGGGTIWTFDQLWVHGGTGDGFCLILPGGSDAVINFYFDWEE